MTRWSFTGPPDLAKALGPVIRLGSQGILPILS